MNRFSKIWKINKLEPIGSLKYEKVNTLKLVVLKKKSKNHPTMELTYLKYA
jgi:hypothetical protein